MKKTGPDAEPIEPVSGGVRMRVRARPRASRTECVGLYGDAVAIRLAAPPVEGAANRELRRFLARMLRVRQGAVTVVRGQRDRTKVVEIQGVDAPFVRAALGLTAGPGSGGHRKEEAS